MSTKAKIKIVDDNQLRAEIEDISEKISKVDIAKWAILIAKHILQTVHIDYQTVEEITQGFAVHTSWQIGEARMYDVRQSGFKIHKLARACEDEIQKTAFRVVGQAVGTGHMKEHAMVASDYAVKTIGLITDNDHKAIRKEREWQLQTLKKLVENNILDKK